MNLIAEKIRRSNASEIHRGSGSNAGQRLQPGLRFSASPLVVLFPFGTYDKRRCGIDNFFPMPIVESIPAIQSPTHQIPSGNP
jgi:hypothetical protein